MFPAYSWDYFGNVLSTIKCVIPRTILGMSWEYLGMTLKLVVFSGFLGFFDGCLGFIWFREEGLRGEFDFVMSYYEFCCRIVLFGNIMGMSLGMKLCFSTVKWWE